MGRPRKLTADDLGSAAWRELSAQILARDGYRCWNCGGVATQADHIVPRVEGGRSVPENLRASCAPCNQAKSMGEAGRSALRKRAANMPQQDFPAAWCCQIPGKCRLPRTYPHTQNW